MLEAAAWGLIAASSLVIGSVLTFWLKPGRRLIGLIMAFGAGTLISAIAYDLVEDAASSGRALALTAGLSAVAAAIGYAFTAAMSLDGVLARSFAAGALLTMLSNSMLPEAHENGGRAVGLMTVLGFAVAFALSQLT